MVAFSLRYYLIEFAKPQGKTPNHTPPERLVTFKINTHLAIRNIPRILNIHHHSEALQRFHNLLALTSGHVPSTRMRLPLHSVPVDQSREGAGLGPITVRNMDDPALHPSSDVYNFGHRDIQSVSLVCFGPSSYDQFGGRGMWYFVAGAVLGVAQLILRKPIQFLQTIHPIQGELPVTVLGAAVYGTLFWLKRAFVFR